MSVQVSLAFCWLDFASSGVSSSLASVDVVLLAKVFDQVRSIGNIDKGGILVRKSLRPASDIFKV